MSVRSAGVLAALAAATQLQLALPLQAAVAGEAPATAAPSPEPRPTLAPIEDQSPAPAPTASSAPKLIGHVVVSAFCSSFIDHFNNAARTMVANDARLDDAVTAVRAYEDDYSRLDGARRAWDHRLALIAALKELLVTIPKTQAAVNDLRQQAKEATDPERRAALAESAAKLQDSVDHQRIVAWEMQEVVGFMLDTHSTNDTISHAVSDTLAPGEKVLAATLDDPVPHPGDSLPGRTQPPPRSQSSVELVLRVPRDRRMIGEAESGAAVAAARVVRTCVQEATPPGPP